MNANGHIWHFAQEEHKQTHWHASECIQPCSCSRWSIWSKASAPWINSTVSVSPYAKTLRSFVASVGLPWERSRTYRCLKILSLTLVIHHHANSCKIPKLWLHTLAMILFWEVGKDSTSIVLSLLEIVTDLHTKKPTQTHRCVYMHVRGHTYTHTHTHTQIHTDSTHTLKYYTHKHTFTYTPEYMQKNKYKVDSMSVFVILPLTGNKLSLSPHSLITKAIKNERTLSFLWSSSGLLWRYTWIKDLAAIITAVKKKKRKKKKKENTYEDRLILHQFCVITHVSIFWFHEQNVLHYMSVAIKSKYFMLMCNASFV